MSQNLPQVDDLDRNVTAILDLVHQESSLKGTDTSAIAASTRKAISPTFEIVFAGAFSAGKSMLINALLERELLYSAEGHATGTECYIAYAPPEAERVVLTFLSEAEIREQANALCANLGWTTPININQAEVLKVVQELCEATIVSEGGESKSEKAKQAKGLSLLLDGFVANRERIHTLNNATYSMEQFNFSNLQEAASFARRGSNSAVLKRIEYYCHHPLLKDGNVLIDTPGIDAPVQKDAELTYKKIEHPDTSAVICVLKAASAGEMSKEETVLLERMRDNPGIRDRVFYVFNRIDDTWYNTQLRQRLEQLISSQFQDAARVYKTSGLLGFYGSQIEDTNVENRFGLNSIFAEQVGSNIEEETPQFVNEFVRYCANSGKLSPSQFKISVHSYESPNANYVRILSEQGLLLIKQLISDSGIEEFRQGITHYLTQEKRPALFANLADDLQPVCISLRNYYLTKIRDLDSQPHEIEGMKAKELERLNQELHQIAEDFREHLTKEINQIVTNDCERFENDFRHLQARTIRKLDELLDTFSVAQAYRRATLSHRRNATAPLIAVLVEALYYLANELEDVLVECCKTVVANLFQRLRETVSKSEYYRHIYRLVGNDAGIAEQLESAEKQVLHALISVARIECDRFVRESPRFYDEGTFSIYQFRQTLQQTSQSYDCESMVEAEPAIRQLLKLDFEPKVSETIRRNFRQTMNQTLKTHLLPLAESQADLILQQYAQARAHLETNLEVEASRKIADNQKAQLEIQEKIGIYNQAIDAINSCLQLMNLGDRFLPTIDDVEFKRQVFETKRNGDLLQ
ncbi:dynamin-like GTPase family protein [Merismopedia glauca]|uniref:Dynamin family protein n=1 Tax=Merismopedia glauca CCAP 1448/3 TaxID=1296344 RepID=A0A2T1C9B3_9CYAN|nr:dynamin-like GTPase family protein [Merismopedia glauca]PSB04737.1 dynamin family protein [Merismopedia glauca CCAP 1448/3]